MPRLTPQQIDRGLSLAEGLLGLATDVWKHRKQRRRGVVGGVAGKLAAAHRKSAKAKTLPRVRARSTDSDAE